MLKTDELCYQYDTENREIRITGDDKINSIKKLLQSYAPTVIYLDPYHK